MAAVVCRTGFKGVKHSAGSFFIPVDLPQAGALAPAGVVGDEARYILRRVAEKQSHLVRKLSALASFERLLVSIL